MHPAQVHRSLSGICAWTEHFGPLKTWRTVRRAIACVVVAVAASVAPPAEAQTRPAGWSPASASPLESAGEIVLQFTAEEAGRIVYYTLDGDCNRNPGVEYPYTPTPVTPDCGRPQAKAGEDYVAVKGEWTFAEPGSRTLRIPIVDDDGDEPEEPFGVHASLYDDVAGQTTWYAALIRISDDDPREAVVNSGATSTSTATTAEGPAREATTLPAPARRQPTGVTAARGPATGLPTTTTPRRDVTEERAATDGLEPGPGFELVSERDLDRGTDGAERGAVSLIAFLASGATIASCAVWARRRRRWSTRW